MTTKKKSNSTSSLIDYTTQYAEAVTRGEIVAGRHVVNSCYRHLNDLTRDDIYFDVAAADRVFQFFETKLKLGGGKFEGKPFILHPSQKFIVGSIFGWKFPSGRRRFRRAYIEMGKGNGKSPLVGGVGLYGMMCDGEEGAEIYAAAASKDQANILFQDAVQMVTKSPSLANQILFTGINPVQRMVYKPKPIKNTPRTPRVFKPLSKESGKTGSGARPHFALCDEIHEHPDGLVIDILERGFKSRDNPLLMMITNSGHNRDSVCYMEHTHAVKVASGETKDDTSFSYVCSLDPEDDPFTDETCWYKANPMLDVILTREYLKGVVDQAQAIAGKANNILRLHFCQWTDSDVAWISRKTWETVEDREMKLSDFEGAKAWVGLDLSQTQDLTGCSVVVDDGVNEDGKSKYALFAFAFTPADTLQERALRDKLPYDVWQREGYLTAVKGKVLSYRPTVNTVLDIANRFDLQCVSYDRHLIRYFEQDLIEAGGDHIPLVEHPQGFNYRRDTELHMPTSISRFEELILEKRIRIQYNPVLRSCVSSVYLVESPAGLRRFDKQRSTSRIDLAVSSAMAIGAATLNQQVESSYTLDNGVMFV